MSLNKFMHPRNKYKKPPDFKALAIKYPEFRKHAKQDISGKVSLNFKNLEAVRTLTYTLLKEDFNLDVEIPLSRLIPTLPLRLNYLLWIEDLLLSNKKTSDIVRGVDIGCGASCVYPLLAAQHFHWHMLATEVDTDSAFIASNNIRRNKLNDMITVRSVDEGIILEGVLQPDTVYDFCMCNPPFFSSTDELDPQHVSRSPNRPPPRNAHSGTPKELVVPGGEIAFVAKYIQDSVKLKELVRIYSVMVGHKTSVSKVKQALREADVSQVVTTEFCQGRTTRWGVAWTLDPAIVLTQDVPLSHKKKMPFSHTSELSVADTVEKLHQFMAELQITYTTLKNNQDLCAMEITALSNTWSSRRKKRRQEELKQIPPEDADVEENNIPCKVENKEHENDLTKTEAVPDQKISDAIEVTNSEKDLSPQIEKEDNDKPKVNNKKDINKPSEYKGENKHILNEGEGSDSNAAKKLKTGNCSSELNVGTKTDPFLHSSLVVKKNLEGSTVFELCWLRGTGGKDAAHQVFQYFKNNLKTH